MDINQIYYQNNINNVYQNNIFKDFDNEIYTIKDINQKKNSRYYKRSSKQKRYRKTSYKYRKKRT